MKHWNAMALALLVALGLAACAPAGEAQSAPSSSSAPAVSDSASSAASSSSEAALSVPSLDTQQVELLDGLWTRLNADQWNEKCWMSGRNLLYFVRSDGGYLYYAGTENSGVGGMRIVCEAQQVDGDTYRVYFSTKQNAVQSFSFDQDVLPYLYLHFAGDQLEVTEVYPAYVAVSDGESENFQCRLPSSAEKANGEDRMRELSETETYYPASGKEEECDLYTYQAQGSVLVPNP